MSSIKSFLFSLLIVVLACSCSTHAKINHKGAYIEIPEKEIKIGAIKKDAMKHIYQVAITNSGDAPLVITEVLSSCYCAEAEMPKQPIQPGDTYDMKVVLDVSEMSLQDPFVREFYVKSNAVNGKEITVSLTGSIVK